LTWSNKQKRIKTIKKKLLEKKKMGVGKYANSKKNI
jgi:hypothetical protein